MIILDKIVLGIVLRIAIKYLERRLKMAHKDLRLKFMGAEVKDESTVSLIFHLTNVSNPEAMAVALESLKMVQGKKIDFWTILYLYMILSGKIKQVEG